MGRQGFKLGVYCGWRARRAIGQAYRHRRDFNCTRGGDGAAHADSIRQCGMRAEMVAGQGGRDIATGFFCIDHQRKRRHRSAVADELGSNQVQVRTRCGKDDIDAGQIIRAAQLRQFLTQPIQFASVADGVWFSIEREATAQRICSGKTRLGDHRCGCGTKAQQARIGLWRAAVPVENLSRHQCDAGITAFHQKLLRGGEPVMAIIHCQNQGRELASINIVRKASNTLRICGCL